MELHYCEQRTDEWFALRTGRMTASDFQTMASVTPSVREKLCLKTAAEIITGQRAEGFKTTAAMQHGIDTEDEAREQYSATAFEFVEEVGFISEGDYLGCSPDGLIGDDGGVEIKCPQMATHLSYVLKGDKAWKAYKWQVQGSLWVTGRSWWDWVSYCPQFGEQGLIIQRVIRDDEMFAKLESGSKLCIKRIEEIVKAAKGESQ